MNQSLAVAIPGIEENGHAKQTDKAAFRLKIVILIMLVIISVVATHLFRLQDELKLAKEQQTLLRLDSIDLSEQLVKYQQLKEELEGDISVKENELQSVANRLEGIESLLGNTNKELDIDSRLDIAAINTAVRLSFLSQIPNGSPVKEGRISSPFGMRIHPVTKRRTMHRGMDYAVNTGTPIYAPADGVIQVVRKSNDGSGNFLRISHSFGITSSYSHLNSFIVHTGEFIKKGDLVAYSGNSGLTSGPHLHYEIRFVGRALNPRPFVDWNIDNFESIFKKQKNIQWESLLKNVEKQVGTALQLSSLK